MSDVTRDTPQLADSYDRISEAQFLLGCSLINKMGVKEGDVMLDVGCGTGRLTLFAADIVGHSGGIIGLDPSPHRIKIAQEKQSEGRFPNVKFMIGAGEDLGLFAEATFDGTYYSSVFHWIREKEKVLNEAYRVLKPGGRIGITMPDPGGLNEFLRSLIKEIVSRPAYSQHFRRTSTENILITKETLDSLFGKTPFVNLKIEIMEKRRLYRSASSLIEFYSASSFGNFLSFMPENLRDELKKDIIIELQKEMALDGLELISKTILAIADKPA